jgi:hypothetical protein
MRGREGGAVVVKAVRDSNERFFAFKRFYWSVTLHSKLKGGQPWIIITDSLF